MTDLSTKVPEAAVVAAFAGVMAISPELYLAKLESLAETHDVPCDDDFKNHVYEVLKKQPASDFD